MADPSWFYSTLAQSTAAVVGFILAMSASIYSSRQARKRRRVADFRNEIQDFQQRFFPLIREVARDMAFEAEFANRDFKLSDMKGDDDDETKANIREWAEKQPDTGAAWCWALTGWIQRTGRGLNSTSDIEEMRDLFNEMKEPIHCLIRVFESHQNNNMKKDIMDTFPDDSQDNVSIRTQIFSKSNQIQKYISEERMDEAPEGSFLSRCLVIEDLFGEYHIIYGKNYLSDPSLRKNVLTPLLKRSYLLFLSGVILPLLFLVYVPNTLATGMFPESLTIVPEVFILLIVTIQTWYFFKEFQSLDDNTGY